MKKYASLLLSTLFIISIITSAVMDVSALGVITRKSGDYEYKVYDGKYAELTEYLSSEYIGGTYSIPSTIDGYTVKYLGGGLFRENDVPAEKVIIPDTVSEIDGYAFYHDDGEEWPEGSRLEDIVIPSGVSRIGDRAFEYCGKLKSVTLPGTLRSLGKGAFYDCRSLKKVTINEGLDTIPMFAFELCTSLESVNHLDGVSSIENYAFFHCPKLKSLSVNENTLFAKYSCGWKFKYGPYAETEGIPKKVRQKDFKLNITSKNTFKKYESDHEALYTASKDYGIPCNYLTKSTQKKDIKFYPGVSFKIKVDGKSPINWTSSNPKVVKVTDSGKVTALKKGTVTLKATLADGSKYSRKMTVFIDPSLSVKTVSVKKGKTVELETVGKAYSVNNVYKNTKIAKITSKKDTYKLKVKGLKKGSTTLKIKVNGKLLKLKVKVK
ncbi:MAG: leucine-rich repeat protein [Ruminococcus sp.]|nr:leucine-rich repeat protein [Ruminococcus sp.]